MIRLSSTTEAAPSSPFSPCTRARTQRARRPPPSPSRTSSQLPSPRPPASRSYVQHGRHRCRRRCP
uniref:Uncharacterized protein n=1 Tax=Arundo donax TaxID=35708 RepID=A0A0A9FX57_ARUDO